MAERGEDTNSCALCKQAFEELKSVVKCTVSYQYYHIKFGIVAVVAIQQLIELRNQAEEEFVVKKQIEKRGK